MKKIGSSKYFEKSPSLNSSWIETPLGLVVAMADDQSLYFLEFVERDRLEKKVEEFRKKINASIKAGTNPIIKLVESELKAYFNGTLKTFTTPLRLIGSSFQKSVWNELLKTPYGETRSYTNQAVALEKPLAYRAIANANGANNIAILIPCHRIINHNGKLGGYGGGISKKKWLIEHEKRNLTKVTPGSL